MPDRPVLRTALLFLVSAALGALAVWSWTRQSVDAARPATTLVVERMREVARLETLDLAVYKKIAYAPEPVPTGALWKDVLAWARSSLFPTRGRAIVFGTVHLGLDLTKLDANHLRVGTTRVEVVLPPLQATAELKPAETEVIDSNLDSAQTALLLGLAKSAFEREALDSPELREKARGSAERALTGLLLSLGFREVVFVEKLPGTSGAGRHLASSRTRR
jgi:hypothetical protein